MTTIADIGQAPTETKCFRPRRYYLIVGFVGVVYFSLVGVGSTIIAYGNLDGSFPQPSLFALFFAIFWSGWTLLSVWNILAYFRDRLLLAGNKIRHVGVVFSRAIDCEDVTKVNWRRWPSNRSIVVRTPSAKITIYLGNFTMKEREELIRFCRETFANEIQENWPQFDEESARRLQPPTRLSTRGGIILTASVLLFFAPIFVYCWFVGLGVQYLLIGVAVAVAAFCYLWRLLACKDRNVTEEATAQERPEC